MRLRSYCTYFASLMLFLFAIKLLNFITYQPRVKLKENFGIPIILWWTESFPGRAETRNCPGHIQCEVLTSRTYREKYPISSFLFYGSNINFSDLPLPRDPVNTIWGLYHEESPRNVEVFLHEPALKIFNFTSTFSRYSDVPYPLQYLENPEDITSRKHYIETSKKNLLLKEIAPILYLQSDCETSTERDEYVKELMKYITIDSYGTCLNNKQLPQNLKDDYLNILSNTDFLNFVARYKFVIAIENGVCEDYITEKFWRAIKVGSVPIYFGSPTIRDWLPNNKSALLLLDYPTPKKMQEHIVDLLNNDNKYEEYLEHKTKSQISNKKLIDNFRENPNQNDALNTTEQFECFVCHKIHEKIDGNTKEYIAEKSHYNCPKPLSALTLAVNPHNSWISSWEHAKRSADRLFREVMNNYL